MCRSVESMYCFYLVRLQRNIADQILYFNQIVQKWQLCTEQFRHVCFSRYRRTCSVLSPRVQRQVAARSICCFVPCKLIWARISNSRYLELALQKMSRTPCLRRLCAKEIENPQIWRIEVGTADYCWNWRHKKCPGLLVYALKNANPQIWRIAVGVADYFERLQPFSRSGGYPVQNSRARGYPGGDPK